jgi:hypothetical protein
MRDKETQERQDLISQSGSEKGKIESIASGDNTANSPALTNDGNLTVKMGNKTMYAYEKVNAGSIKPEREKIGKTISGILSMGASEIGYQISKAKKDKEIKSWVASANEGKLLNGSIIDAGYGGVSKHYMYFDGKLYLIGDQAGKANVKF